jgi:hypothetical protein
VTIGDKLTENSDDVQVIHSTREHVEIIRHLVFRRTHAESTTKAAIGFSQTITLHTTHCGFIVLSAVWSGWAEVIVPCS